MTAIPDLAGRSYSFAAFEKVRPVGWIEATEPYAKGAVDKRVQRRLRLLVARPPLLTAMFGLHSCSLCQAEGRTGPDPRSSQNEILVPGDGVVYEAPVWVLHYVTEHGYRPPSEFNDAVLRCPRPGSSAYRRAVVAIEPGLDRFLEVIMVGGPIGQLRMRLQMLWRAKIWPCIKRVARAVAILCGSTRWL